MQINVTKNKVTAQKGHTANEGEYNIRPCEFTFSEDYTEDLAKVAVFSKDGKSYKVSIVNNQCVIPIEVLETKGDIIIGVYAYSVEEEDGEEILKERFSPAPSKIFVDYGSYVEDAENASHPTPTELEQLDARISVVEEEAEQISVNTQDIAELQENKADKNEIPTKTSDLINDSSFVQDPNYVHTDNNFTNTYKAQIQQNTSDINTLSETKADRTEIPDVSDFITKDVNNLTNYTTTTNMNTAINTAVGNETTARQQSDTNLQGQIDAITSASDVVDVVSTYQDLLDYDTTKLTDKDVIKVMQDSTHSNALSYYRWSSNQWSYIGSEGPFYTKSETETLVNAKYSKPNSGIPKTDLASDVQTSLGKADSAIQSTDIATSNKAGIIKTNPVTRAVTVSSGGTLQTETKTYQEYNSIDNQAFIGKGTLENVITGKELINQDTLDNSQEEQNATIEELQNKIAEQESIINQMPQVSDEGYDATLNNTIEAPFRKFEIEGHSEQETTSISGGDEYDSPSPEHEQPIKSCGDNAQLFDKETMGTRYYRYIVANRNQWDPAQDSYSIAIPCEPNKTYTLSHSIYTATIFRCGYIKETTIPDTGSISLYNQYVDSNVFSHTIETGEDATYIVFQGNASLMPDIIETLKLEERTEATPWSPYFNGMGSISEKIINKNWFDGEMELGTLGQTGQPATTNNSVRTKNFQRVLASTTYAISNDKSYQNVICLYDKNHTFIERVSGSPSTFTTTADTYYAKWRTSELNVENDTSVKFQLELGSTASDYVAHEEQTYTIPTQQPMRSIGEVRDVFFKNKVDSPYYDSTLTLNAWYERHIIKERRLTSSTDISISGNYGVDGGFYRFYIDEKKNGIDDGEQFMMCNLLSYVRLGNSSDHSDEIGFMNCSNIELRFRTHKGTLNLDALKEWLDDNELYFYYILIKNIVNLPCTQAQIDILENLPKSYTGQTNVYSIDEIEAYLKVSQLLDLNSLVNN